MKTKLLRKVRKAIKLTFDTRTKIYSVYYDSESALFETEQYSLALALYYYHVQKFCDSYITLDRLNKVEKKHIKRIK